MRNTMTLILGLFLASSANAQWAAMCQTDGGPDGGPLCQAFACGATPQAARNQCSQKCPGGHAVSVSTSSCGMPHPGAAQTPADPIVNDEERPIPFSSAASLNAVAFMANTMLSAPQQHDDRHLIAPNLLYNTLDSSDFTHARFFFNPGRRGKNAYDKTVFNSGPFDIPDDVRINSVYVWIPDNKAFYTTTPTTPSAIIFNAVSDQRITYRSGRTFHGFSLSGWNGTDRGHYIIVDMFFQKKKAVKAK